MKKLILSVFISMLATGSYAQNQVGFGPDLGIGMNITPTDAVPEQYAPPQNYPTNYLTPPVNNANRMPVRTPTRTPMPTNGYNGAGGGFDHSNVEDYAPPDTNYKPVYKNDPVVVSAPVSAPVSNLNSTITPAKTQGSLFEECMIRSSKMLDVLDVLKKIPEKDRISTLYNSGYWSELTDGEKDQTLQTIANMSGVDDPTYLLIKGKMAGSFEKECVDLAKNN
jgi:hypothetical protein